MDNNRIQRYSVEQYKFFQWYLISYLVISCAFLINKPNNYLNLWYYAIYFAIVGFFTIFLTPISFIYKSARYINLTNVFLNIGTMAAIAFHNNVAITYYYNNKPGLLFYMFLLVLKNIYILLYLLFNNIERCDYLPVHV